METKEAPSTIRLRGIRKLYQIGGETLAALDGIDLDIRRGEFEARAIRLREINTHEHPRLS